MTVLSTNLIEQRVAQELAASPVLQEAVIVESQLLELLTRAAGEQDGANRWQRYEELKRAGSRLVGWRAAQQELRSSGMYEAFIEALDKLLPTPDEEQSEDDD